MTHSHAQPPKPDGWDEAIEQLRASGATPEQLTVFARIVDHLARTLRVDLSDDGPTPHAH